MREGHPIGRALTNQHPVLSDGTDDERSPVNERQVLILGAYILYPRVDAELTSNDQQQH